MLSLPKKLIVFDVEYTSWKGAMDRGWSGPNEYKEVVQIGAVLLETKYFDECAEFCIYVRPKKNPILSEYFVKLTGITQEKIDRDGVEYDTALEHFRLWSDDYHMYSYGGDEKELRGNCELIGIPFSFDSRRFSDIRDTFREFGIPVRNYTSSTILEAFGKKRFRSAHDALNDARTIADGLRELALKVETR